MPTIIRAEYLSYYNPARNSDKIFNIFLVRNDEGTFSCLTENGRRGSRLVPRIVCAQVRREAAEQKFWEKVREKRNHRETPYTSESLGRNCSQIASQHNTRSDANTAQLPSEFKSPRTETAESKPNVIAFPANSSEANKGKTNGILNAGQFDSLEF